MSPDDAQRLMCRSRCHVCFKQMYTDEAVPVPSGGMVHKACLPAHEERVKSEAKALARAEFEEYWDGQPKVKIADVRGFAEYVWLASRGLL